MKTKVLFFILCFLPFISNELWAQNTHNDAYFQDESSHELRSPEEGVGLGFDELSPTGGYGFTFDLFDESIGNGFEFDNFGNELNYNSLEFGNFDMAADDVPLNGGHLLLLGFALVFLRLQDYKTTSQQVNKTTRQRDYKTTRVFNNSLKG